MLLLLLPYFLTSLLPYFLIQSGIPDNSLETADFTSHLFECCDARKIRAAICRDNERLSNLKRRVMTREIGRGGIR